MNVEYRIADLEEILDLRDRILIQGTMRVSAEFEGDRDSLSLHYAAVREGTVVGCLSLHDRDFEREPAYQLRGMAVERDLAGQGIGAGLLRFAELDAQSRTARAMWWCNARSGAVGFYEKMGWQKVTEEFEIKGVGPHYVMVRHFSPRVEPSLLDEG
jgi:N-acetylglutamate synthase-like GNAT family acetyltransferase